MTPALPQAQKSTLIHLAIWESQFFSSALSVPPWQQPAAVYCRLIHSFERILAEEMETSREMIQSHSLLSITGIASLQQHCIRVSFLDIRVKLTQSCVTLTSKKHCALHIPPKFFYRIVQLFPTFVIQQIFHPDCKSATASLSSLHLPRQ